MKRYLTVLIALAAVAPSMTSAQLTSRERERAQELARIQAKADTDERERVRRSRLDSARSLCRLDRRQWDAANETCKPR